MVFVSLSIVLNCINTTACKHFYISIVNIFHNTLASNDNCKQFNVRNGPDRTTTDPHILIGQIAFETWPAVPVCLSLVNKLTHHFIFLLFLKKIFCFYFQNH